MAIRKIVKIGDDTLRKVCRPVTQIDKRILTLLGDMAETMYAADGVGLAAPQVGILRRVVVIDVGEGLVELINPGPEGCLSVPGRRGLVERPTKVTVHALDRKGREIEVVGTGLMAVALCHEIDHLDGVIYVDKMIKDITDQEEEE